MAGAAQEAKSVKRPHGKAGVVISPQMFDAVLFDMDGVVTKTAQVHAGAWKQMFDDFLAKHKGAGFEPFDIERDYRLYVDGKPRYDGVKSFLESRGIDLPPGKPEDEPGFATICALGNLKNKDFIEQVDKSGVEAYETTVALIEAVKKAGLKTAVITASENGEHILRSANANHLFDTKVDGLDAIRLGLKGKPAPDVFIKASGLLNVEPSRCVVVEDAPAGVEAGRKGGFGLVIGVDRTGQSGLLKDHGAHAIVHDLSEVEMEGQPAVDLPGMVLADARVTNENWVLTYDHFDPDEEGRRESLCALGNGYFTTRAAAPESSADDIHYPGTYIAGAYNRLKTDLGGFAVENEDLVNMPNWLTLGFRINGGAWFDLNEVEILAYRQSLNLKEGILYRQIRFRDEKERETSISECRFVHIRHFHLAGLKTEITSHNWSGQLTVRSALDGRIVNNGCKGYRLLNNRHLLPVESFTGDGVLCLKMKTNQSFLSVAQAARTGILRNGESINVLREDHVESDYVAQDINVSVSDGDTIAVEKVASLFTSRDRGICEPCLSARQAVDDAPSFDKLLDDQIEEWRHLWRRFDISLETAEKIPKIPPSLIMHLHCFHVLQAASPNSADLDSGLPARGWTGEAYRGHVFWDDLFVFPFLNLRMPYITRSLLRYRYRRLPEARRIAKQMGASGARYPWESAGSGREETPQFGWDQERERWVPIHTQLQIHVNAAIAYNIWQHYQVTGDIGLIYHDGADVMLEIARFFASIARYNPQRDRYEIHGVVGPDEFHSGYPDAQEPGINNNAYTNVMAAWTLMRAIELLQIIPRDHHTEVCERLDLTASEIESWDEISRKIFVPWQEDGIISQFEGYEKLDEFPRLEDGTIDIELIKKLLGQQGGQLNQYKVSKQADVLMLFYIFSAEELEDLFTRLGYSFPDTTIPKNIEYYIPQTVNFSTLSRVSNAWVLSRLDRPGSWKILARIFPDDDGARYNNSVPHSWDMLLEALGSDLLDIQGGTTPEGIHMGAMAGTIDIMQRGYTGIVTAEDVLWLNPQLPEALTRLSFNLQYRNQSLRIEITHKLMKIAAQHSSAKAVSVGFRDEVHSISAGETLLFDLDRKEIIRDDAPDTDE